MLGLMKEDALEDQYSSDGEVDQFEARLKGASIPAAAWVLSDRDVWYRNPSYLGIAQRCPEDGPCEGCGSWNQRCKCEHVGLAPEHVSDTTSVAQEGPF